MLSWFASSSAAVASSMKTQARAVQQQPGEGQPLLLAEREDAVPALLLVQPRDQVGQAAAGQRRLHRRVGEVARRRRIGDAPPAGVPSGR